LIDQNKTEKEITAIINSMYENIGSGVDEQDAIFDAMELIKQEVGYKK